MGFAGGAFGFLLSFLGGLQTATATITQIEDGMRDFLVAYGNEQYNFEQLFNDPETKENMEEFLNVFTYDLIFYSSASLWHALFLLLCGFAIVEISWFRI